MYFRQLQRLRGHCGHFLIYRGIMFLFYSLRGGILVFFKHRGIFMVGFHVFGGILVILCAWGGGVLVIF